MGGSASRLIQFEFTARAQMHVPAVELACWRSLILRRGAENVVALGMRCCRLPWFGSAGGSCRALRTCSPCIVCRRSVLRSQIFGVGRRDVGAKPGGHRRRDRGGAALSEKSAGSNRAGRYSLGDAVKRVTDPRQDSSGRKTRWRRSLYPRTLPGQSQICGDLFIPKRELRQSRPVLLTDE